MKEWFAQRLEQMGVPKEQSAMVVAAAQAKREARGAYQAKLAELGKELDEKTKDAFVTDKDLLATLQSCKQAQKAAEVAYQKVVAEQDAKIIAGVSAMAQVKLFLGGILENNGVFAFPQGGGFGGFGGGRGGPGGGRPRGGQ